MTTEFSSTGTLNVATLADNETISTVFSDSPSPETTTHGEIVTTGLSFATTAASEARNFRFEDYTQRTIIATVFCTVAMAGLVGNIMVILAVILSNKLQTRTNAFVVNLATADLLTCISIPFSAVALFSKTGWPLPDIVCSLAAAVTFGGVGCSILNLAAIALNRFVLITKTRETYMSIYTPKKISVMLIFTWLYPMFICCFPLVGVGKWGYSDKYKTCTQDTSLETSDLYSGLYSGLIYPIPLIIMFVCYYKVYRHIKNHLKKMSGNEMPDISVSSTSSTREIHTEPSGRFSKRQVEITKNLFYVMCAFIVCLAPFAVALMIPPSDPVIPWTGMITIFNSAVNPVIYGVKHPHFKEVFRHMLRCRYHMIPEPSSCLRKMRATS